MKPTYLYIKEHSVTGLRYLGKTTKSDPYKYQGSGKHWVRHINKHGLDHVKTIWVSEPFTDKSRLVEFAMLMSEELDVVKSNKWANNFDRLTFNIGRQSCVVVMWCGGGRLVEFYFSFKPLTLGDPPFCLQTM